VGAGGGINNHGHSLTLSHSTVSDNHAGYGGGIFSSAGTVEILHSTIAGNTGTGGGIYLLGGVLFLTNSTISGNYSDEDGGGIYTTEGTLWTYNATIVYNGADVDVEGGGGHGGGIKAAPGGVVYLRNSVVAGNYRTGFGYPDDCKGTIGSFGRNKFSTFDGCTITQQNPNGDFDLVGSLSEIGPLRFNGGATMTRALLPPSTMINGANATAGCTYGGPLLVDQRGGTRGQGAACGLGAFEFGALPAGSLSADGFELGQLWAWGARTRAADRTPRHSRSPAASLHVIEPPLESDQAAVLPRH
jgi:predicted outer membrane repeat protein